MTPNHGEEQQQLKKNEARQAGEARTDIQFLVPFN